MNMQQKYKIEANQKIKFRLVDNLITELPGTKHYKPVLFFYQLRALSNNNCITEASPKIKELAAAIGISRRNFYYQLKACYKLRIIYKKHGNFYFKSSAFLCAALDIAYSAKYTWIKSQLNNLDCCFRKRVIKAAHTAQYKRVCEKLQKTQTESLPAHEVEKMREYLLNNFIQNFKNKTQIIDIGINPDIAISQTRIAKLFNKTSQYCGYYWQSILQKKKLIQVNNRVIYSDCYNTKTKLIGRIKFNLERKQTYLQLTNEIIFE
jgi:DNA-binding transcriptional ArsR family regulator